MKLSKPQKGNRRKERTTVPHFDDFTEVTEV